MADNDNIPKQNPIEPGEERIDDGPEQDLSEGEPRLTGRHHGFIIDDDGAPTGKQSEQYDAAQEESDEGEDYESGRHNAAS